ncbi:MAG: hypothetical protein A2Y62_02830 [Candidatus Fischerbacteria bacterium RBG_13_37_8]|uniref:CheR-type methyltransferase domain-containing protein n=1 Tax=Candidatus Fischerbacteria bacterium RBG_13_37_8 TaxID=1817863 RepID=A0A1F5VYY9_9BACT|nr:MAG: hypothetical protein A2Y62_02830 [Candidatus Fischerbacteria bacterium RBG_13_37_8]
MITVINKLRYKELSEFLAEHMGLNFPPEKRGDLERGIRAAAKEFGYEDTELFIQKLIEAPLTKNQIEMLAEYLTVGETYFFREKKLFDILETHILPELIHKRYNNGRYLRIWSAGCSSGEEPYSVAMLLHQLIPDIKNWDISILATDINQRALKKTSNAIYKEWSFRDTPEWIKNRYFTKRKDDRYELLKYIKKMVTVSYHNLAQDVYPSRLNNATAVDIIFCRNVLMYFVLGHSKRVIQNLHRSLIEGGWLIVSPCEASHVLFDRFKTMNYPGVILYQKVMEMNQKDENVSDSLHCDMHLFQPLSANVSGQEVVQDVELEKSSVAKPVDETGQNGEEEIRVKNPDIATMALLARVHANLGRLTEAYEWCEKAITADKLNHTLYYLKASILQEQGLMEQAIAALKQALYLKQNFVIVHYMLGNLLQRSGKCEESKKYFNNALMLLDTMNEEEIVPESEGIVAGQLKKIIQSLTSLSGLLSLLGLSSLLSLLS